jgi:uncharacterized protein (TIGR03118 family)
MTSSSKLQMVYAKRALLGAAIAMIGGLLPLSTVAAAGNGSFRQINLAADTPGAAQRVDANLVNPWGLASGPFGPWVIADNGAGKASAYSGDGQSVFPAVSIPSPDGGAGAPTGAIFNKIALFDQHAFTVKEGTKSGPSIYMFATEDGTIAGWNFFVNSSKAIIAVDRSTATDSQGDTGAIYKGLATGSHDGKQFVYTTNFRFGTIEAFDQNFQLAQSFTDTQLTHTCVAAGQCYAPFGIQNIHGKLYVTFALQDADKKDDQAGAGRGFVDVFNPDGTLVKRLIAHGNLNAPWGLATAPRGFGQLSGDLLVGNFGDGTINAYDPDSGALKGTIKDQNGNPIAIDGLWGIAFGNGGLAGDRNELFFTAGPGDEAHGLFGKVVENQ